MKYNVIIWKLYVRNLAGSNLGCIGLGFVPGILRLEIDNYYMGGNDPPRSRRSALSQCFV